MINYKFNGALGTPFIAFAPFVGVAIGVYLFGRYGSFYFNPAVTVGFLITKHITKLQLLYYLTAEKTEVIYIVMIFTLPLPL